MKPNNIIHLKCTEASFFRLWMEFLTPFHKLTDKERDVAARILAQYFKLKSQISDPEVLKDVLWSKKSRQDMMTSLGMSQAYFCLELKNLRASGVLFEDNSINPKYIPHISENPVFMLQLVYDWSSDDNRINRETK